MGDLNNEVGFDDYVTIAELIDTFGMPCSYEECEEPIRTVGIAIQIRDEETGESDLRMATMCHAHLSSFLEDHIYTRTHDGLYNERTGEVVPRDYLDRQ